MRNLGKATSVYCDSIRSPSIVQFLLKFTDKEVHVLRFHTSVAEFSIMLLVKIFTNLSRKKKKKKKIEKRKKKKLNGVLKIKGFLVLFSAALRWSSAVITGSRTTSTISYYSLFKPCLFISEGHWASASRRQCQGPSLLLRGSSAPGRPSGTKRLLMRYARLSREKSCCISKTASCTYPSNQQEINGMLFIGTLRRVSHRARARVSLRIKNWL